MAVMKIIRSSGQFRFGITVLTLLIVAALAHEWLISLLIGDTDPRQVGAYGILESPSRNHWLGTDPYGRDWLAMNLLGLPSSLAVAGIAGIISTLLGAIVGFYSGFAGGRTDAILRTMTDMLLVIPTLPLILILGSYARGLSIVELALVLSAFSWPFAARVIRSQVLSLRERPYVELSRMSDLRNRHIIVQDILPNMLPYLGIGLATSSVGAAFALVGLTIIGLAPSGVLDLGTLLSLALEWGALSLGKWPLFFAPMTLLILLFLGAAFISQGLEEFYNPRLQGRR
ncbi:MAG TPA: ABC transporter permease [Thermomicrobiales bacterium]|nr:ABC transporter permease [Thermomicrobiales bacterium]